MTTAFISYGDGKRTSENSDRFGTGESDGIIALKAPNNAVTGGALDLTLALGILGDSGTGDLIGAYSIRANFQDIFVAVAAGIIDLMLRYGGYQLVTIVIDFVLGAPFETSLRQGLILAQGQPLNFFANPIYSVLVGITILLPISPVLRALWAKRNSTA